MKVLVEFNNCTKHDFKKSFFADVCEETVRRSGLHCGERRELLASVACVEKGVIADINATYRKKDGPTDVLSFCEFENIDEICAGRDRNIFLGELLVCPDVVYADAAKNGVSDAWQMARVVSHGMLHMLGYKHGEDMFYIQDEVAEIFAPGGSDTR